MKCPECGSESFVIDSRVSDKGKCVTRRRGCLCGARWTTHETKVGGAKIAPLSGWMVQRKSPLHAGEREPDNPLQTVDKPTANSGANGKANTTGSGSDPQQAVVSASLSDPDPISSGSSLLPDPDLFPKGDQEVDREKAPRSKSSAIVYPPEFSGFWDAIKSNRSKGLKSDALTAWTKRGRPPAAILIVKWEEYLASLGDTYAKDVCRWLAARGWEEIYDPPTQPPRRSGPTAANVSVLDKFLRKGNGA